jgi:hypothetical protein
MRRGFHRREQREGAGHAAACPSREPRTGAAMTADEFENLNDQQAELWIAQRFRAFVLTGWPPDLSLMFAVHPEVDAPMEIVTEGSLDTAA